MTRELRTEDRMTSVFPGKSCQFIFSSTVRKTSYVLHLSPSPGITKSLIFVNLLSKKFCLVVVLVCFFSLNEVECFI